MLDNNRQQSMRRRRNFLLVVLIISTVLLSLYLLLNQEKSPNKIHIPPTKRHISTPTTLSNNFYKLHILGGFSANTPYKAIKAARAGIQVEFQYGNPPAESDTLGQTLQSLHMKVVDGFISSYLFYYECQRSRAIIPPPYELNTYCGHSSYPTFASEDAFLATITAHLKQVSNNHLILGYWILDDWAPWDEGGARQLLIKIHALIQQYTPSRPAICGFGGDLTANHTFGWEDWLADNFSPQGCDEVGLYIYATSISATSNPPSSETYDWSMSSILPAIFSSLQQRGWNMAKEPFIGIGQAFGGPIAYSNRYRVAPNENEMEMQSRSFCEHGAIGLTFYGWSDSEIGAASQSPMNSSEVENGIRNGIAACIQYWNRHSRKGN